MLTVSRLAPLTLNTARQLQERLIEAITREFQGNEWLTRGELGVGIDGRGSQFTQKVERVLARLFHTEDAVLVTGAGTGAIRAVLFAMLASGSRVLIHDAPLYSTTGVTFRAAGYQAVRVDFNNQEQLQQALEYEEVQAVYIQHTRQQLKDSYDLATVIRLVRTHKPNVLIVIDDNYAVANTPQIGVEMGADASAFSAFKLLGPEGIGIVCCTSAIGARIRADMYSGGTRVQGYQAQEVLLGLSSVFVQNALTQEAATAVVEHIRQQKPAGISEACIANVQSPVILVRFEQPIGPRIVEQAARFGAAPFPVGAMSRYELVPMFYRVSGTMIAELGEENARHWIRINPMRAGAQTVLAILEKAQKEVENHVS
ncbi:Cys/Met metabolism PLP-dependent enzyme [Thermosporothrix hazakensis]|jgi:hypothetical protein|uniref:Cys/Met metabolism PLP-dependent enzyme n=2 Tax=Thermosporothrix TaxID=768650 RepID=A0A326TZS7_THEHA|nr:aminotransferase class V-fold PLP-dependent enzyme [Thermosporothrix hazakensis]PZW22954.1 Cys/Met metabolism PLP-dependent enzyme [Thermosporothrix hazakensis]BBH90046.1 hypothetical protein KTC_47970 [Thermosporothrix sp. COM3]GCE48267.1 hypothetical protein KTH_31360 [Thermosporothrix hazakensis]